jgi:ABC-type transporter Mla subunit MlaD
MLLRICLILAILTGVGVIGVSQFMLKPQIEEIITTRDYNKTEWDKSKSELAKTKTTLKNTSEKLAKTESTLEETKTQLTATTAKFEGEQKRANGLQDNLNKSNGELKAAKDELFAYTSTSIKPEEIKGLVASVKSLTVENQSLVAEVKVFSDKAKTLKTQLDVLLGKENQDPPLPRDLRGKVVVVDPKWDFLVLDIGAKSSLVQNGVLLVSRNGELVAKVRVMEVQENRSIANIMPGWKIKDVTEGDLVLPY